MAGTFRFSFGPWNLHSGQDPFGPEVRDEFTWQEKLAMYNVMGFEGVQFHDDDAVPDINGFVQGFALTDNKKTFSGPYKNCICHNILPIL